MGESLGQEQVAERSWEALLSLMECEEVLNFRCFLVPISLFISLLRPRSSYKEGQGAVLPGGQYRCNGPVAILRALLARRQASPNPP